VLLSAIRRSGRGGGLVVRIYNPLRVGTAGTVRFYRPLREAHELNLNEERRGSLEVVGRDAIAVELRGGEIGTFELVPA
jgi:alpha-mannosidase